MHRLFVGIHPPVSIRAHLLAMMGGIVGARWQDDTQLHITVRFIGSVDRNTAEDVAAALDGVRFPSFSAHLEGVGLFDKRGRLNAVWAGAQPRETLLRLHKKVDQALVRAGLEPERRAYLPHVTLARLNASPGAADQFLQAHAGLSSPPFDVTHLLLLESHLGGEGARYETIARYPLDNAAAAPLN